MIARLLLAAVSVLVCAIFMPTARAEWPERPIRWIVPFGPGGANDLIARVAAEGVRKRLGQPIVIENRPGAGAVVGPVAVAKPAPYPYPFPIGAPPLTPNNIFPNNLTHAHS